MSSILADQQRPRIWAQMRGGGVAGFQRSANDHSCAHGAQRNFADLPKFLLWIAVALPTTFVQRTHHPWDVSSKGRIIPGAHHPRDASSQGRIIQGQRCSIPGTHHPRDASSNGRIIQRTHHPRDVSSKERIIQEHSFGDTLSWHHIFYLGIISSQINKMYK